MGYWLRQTRMGRRHPLGEVELDRSVATYCRQRSLPPPYSLEGADSAEVAAFKHDPTDSPPGYRAIEEDTSSFVVFISNIQKMLSLHTQGGDQFLRLLETEPSYLLEILQQHQQENQECLLNSCN